MKVGSVSNLIWHTLKIRIIQAHFLSYVIPQTILEKSLVILLNISVWRGLLPTQTKPKKWEIWKESRYCLPKYFDHYRQIETYISIVLVKYWLWRYLNNWYKMSFYNRRRHKAWTCWVEYRCASWEVEKLLSFEINHKNVFQKIEIINSVSLTAYIWLFLAIMVFSVPCRKMLQSDWSIAILSFWIVGFLGSILSIKFKWCYLTFT